MILAHFPEVNLVVAKDQPQYQPLPAYRYLGPEGRLCCCWKLSWRERAYVFLTGTIWHQVLTFNTPLQPQLLSVEKPDMGDR
jgi:hypothetical protein